jgi:hypothetical protein
MTSKRQEYTSYLLLLFNFAKLFNWANCFILVSMTSKASIS